MDQTPEADPSGPPPSPPPPPYAPAPWSPPPLPQTGQVTTTPLFPVAPAPPAPAAPAPPEPVAAPKVKRRRRVGWIIAVSLLSVALLGVGALLVLTIMRLDEANTVIDEQNDLIDEKETFSTAMGALLTKSSEFDGQKVGSLISPDDFQLLAARAWNERRDADSMARIIRDVGSKTDELEAQLAAARDQAATNTSGTKYEEVVDALGAGFVATSIDNADVLCSSDVLGCVVSDDPYTVHIDEADVAVPYMTDFIRTGLTYHEFAHVLQMTNPAQTDVAVEAFGGDPETMADCFALTYVDGWTLHHTVWVSDFEYYEVDVGYGYTCDSAQRDAIVAWYDGLGYQSQPVSQ